MSLCDRDEVQFEELIDRRSQVRWNEEHRDAPLIAFITI